MSTSKPPALTYGAAYLPEDKGELQQIINVLKEHKISNIDTARSYPNSEQVLAELGAVSQFDITTKVKGFFAGSGRKENVLESAKTSFEALKSEKVDVFMLHAPDPSTPISEALEVIQELYKQGKFNRFGISNFTAEQVQEAYDYAKSKGYVLPTVFQSNYNLIARKNETLLFPTLRKLGMTIQAYSPVAGGFLMKTPEFITSVSDGGRWDPNTFLGQMYHWMYNKPSLLNYLKEFGELSEKSGISRVGIAYRWTRYHSALKEGDTLICGSKSPKQLEETLKEVEKGPLEDWIVEKLEKMWQDIEKDAPLDNYEFSKTLS